MKTTPGMTLLRLMAFFSMLFPALSSYAQFQLNGDAANTGADTYRLTRNDFNLSGSIWYKLQHDLSTPLNVQGRMNFGTTDADGADGIAFVLQNNCLAAGTAGGGIGYENLPGQSVAVEFDTYENNPSSGSYDNHDPAEDHIGVMRNGIVDHGNATANLLGANNTVQMNAANVNVEDGVWYDFQISYDPATKMLKVYFDGILRVNLNYDIVANVFGGSPYVYWGFTSSTGGKYNEQQVYINPDLTTFTLENQTTCTAPVSVSLPPLTRYYGLNQALGKQAFAFSSQWDVTTNPREAIDGNMGSRWGSSTVPPINDNDWIYVDLGTSYDLDSVVLYWEGAFGSGYLIQTSNDAITWTTQYTETAGNGDKDKIIFSATGRYVKMQGVTRGTAYGYSLWEFLIYGKPNYLWSPNDGSINDIYSATPIFTPAVTTTYTVVIPDPCNGSVSYNMTITVDCTPMPLTLLSFTGKHRDNITHLNWTTSWESNTSYFTVMRSTDGVHFTPVGKVAAAGNSNTLKAYGLDDPHTPQGITYYKLISTDLDGSGSASNIITVQVSDETDIYITEPVFNTSTSLILPGYTDWVNLTVVDVQGRTLIENYRATTDGVITFGNALPSNTSFYLAIVQTALERKVFKIIKTE